MKLRTIILSFTLLTVSTAFAGLFMYYDSIKTAALKEDLLISESHTEAIKSSFSQMISRYHRIALSLSRHKELTLALAETSEGNLNSANEILDLYKSSMQTDVCYLLNMNGVAVASSNRNDTYSFIGKNYSFRPYFYNSMKGSPFVYMALGVTSGRRGIYFSSPIYAPDSGSIIGVSVIKDDIDKFENEILVPHYPSHLEHNDVIFITNKDGVIFISDHQNLLFHSLWQINNDKVHEIAASMQFGDGPWPWAGYTKISEGKAIDPSGRNYDLLTETLENLPDWTIIHLSDSNVMVDRIHESFLKTSSYVFYFVFIIIGSVLVVLHYLANKAEKNLRNSEQWYRSVTETVNEGIVLQAATGEILTWNKGAETIFGIPAKKAIGRTSEGKDWPTIREDGSKLDGRDHPSMKTLRTGKPCRNEIMGIYQPSGELRWIAVNTNPVFRENIEKPYAVAISFSDITEQKRMQEQLNQAQKMESVGRLAGGVAHDFNNMLGIILGYAEMALDQVEPSEPLHANLQEIRKAANRSADLTRQLLAFACKQTVSPKVLDLNETIENMLKMLRRLIGEDIDLVWLPGKNLWPVKLDPSQIDQILANLCVNARDALRGVGKVTIETCTLSFDAANCADHLGFVPGDYVTFALSDNGCGMDKKILDNIFEPFFTTKDVGQGSGLGLATVYGIVKQNNGFINVYSESGRGTTFKIYLPRHMETEGREQTTVSAGAAAAGHETILLVEDEKAILTMTSMMLERLGYSVLTAAAPSQAIRISRSYSSRIDLLMTDVVMPEMSGRDLAEKLLYLNPDLKCLYMSGYTANVIAHHGVLDKGVHFIHKPFTNQDLATKVREVLDEARTTAQS